MMTIGKALLCTAALFSCAACDAVLGQSEEKAKRAVTELLIDPVSAQFRNVHTLGESVCGEVNGKNKMGAYVGFVRFVVSTSDYDAQIDPQFDYTDLISARDLCTQTRSNEYSSVSTTTSICDRATELEFDQIQQTAFDRAWSKECGPTIAKKVYRPPLSGEPASANAVMDINLDMDTLPPGEGDSGPSEAGNDEAGDLDLNVSVSNEIDE